MIFICFPRFSLNANALEPEKLTFDWLHALLNAILSWYLIFTLFGWLWLVAGADLLRKKSTIGWLVAGGWCWFGVREKYYWLIEANSPAPRCTVKVGLSSFVAIHFFRLVQFGVMPIQS